MGQVQDWYNYIEDYNWYNLDFDRRTMFPCTFSMAAYLDRLRLLHPELLAEFESRVLDSWQNADSFYDFMDRSGMEVLRRAAAAAGIDYKQACTYHCEWKIAIQFSVSICRRPWRHTVAFRSSSLLFLMIFFFLQ